MLYGSLQPPSGLEIVLGSRAVAMARDGAVAEAALAAIRHADISRFVGSFGRILLRILRAGSNTQAKRLFLCSDFSALLRLRFFLLDLHAKN